jgi:hypothetical protein
MINILITTNRNIQGSTESLLGMFFVTTDKHRNIPKRKTPYYHHLSTIR